MNPIHILLIEDNEGDALLTRLAFEEAGLNFYMSVVNDGKEAIEFLNKENSYTNADKPGLIFLDINLPKKNGHEILKYIKGNEILKNIPVIMLTTSSAKIDIDMAFNNGAGEFITKPSDVNDFFAVVTAIAKLWIAKVRLPD